MRNARAAVTQPRTIDREDLNESLRHPHPESLEMAEVGFATWAEGLSDDASDLIAPGAGEAVRWSADRGWVVPEK
jgi:hypothetical protein